MKQASFWTTLHRITKLGAINFWRNRLLSIAATLVMTITLLTISIFVILNLIINTTIKTVNKKIDLVVYFNEDVSEQNINTIWDQSKSLSGVALVDYIDKSEALKRWRQRQSDERLKEAVTEKDNPLPRSLEIKVQNPEKIEQVAIFFDNEQIKPMVRKTSLHENKATITRLINFTKFIRKVGISISLFFALVSVLIIFNTIRLAIYSRRGEIEIMKLVGASSSFIKGPFILEGIFYGILGTTISITLLYMSFRFLSPITSKYLGDVISEWGGNLLNYFTANLFWVIALQLIIGVIIGTGCSLIAMRKHLQV